jgi:hypothetical protein
MKVIIIVADLIICTYIQHLAMSIFCQVSFLSGSKYLEALIILIRQRNTIFNIGKGKDILSDILVKVEDIFTSFFSRIPEGNIL